MARIAGVDLPNEKRVEIGLTYIYGVGRVTANKILEATKINPDTRVKDLTENDIGKIREYMDKNRSFPSIKGTLYHFYHYLNDNCTCCSLKLTIFAPEFRSL